MAVVLEDGVIKPSKLVIVGNGFDIEHQAKTRYEDFYACLKDCFESLKKDDFLKKYLSEDKSNDYAIEKFYSVIKDNSDNYFINYFLKYKTIFHDWVSFEKELTTIIKSFDTLLDYLNSPKSMELYIKYGGLCIDVSDKPDLMHTLSVNEDNKFFKARLSFLSSSSLPSYLFQIKIRSIVLKLFIK